MSRTDKDPVLDKLLCRSERQQTRRVSRAPRPHRVGGTGRQPRAEEGTDVRVGRSGGVSVRGEVDEEGWGDRPRRRW